MAINQQHFWQAYNTTFATPLTTEQPNPKTAELSQLAQAHLPSAIDLMQQAEAPVFACIAQQESLLAQLAAQCQEVSQQGRIFLVGCGSSGRAAALIEALSRQQGLADSVHSVIAGGDIALLEAVEGFEDGQALAIKQLQQQGFKENDLLIGLSASGSSPFILSALNYAVAHSHHAPWLVHSNPADQLLARHPKHPLAEKMVHSLLLDVGPMALTGSTRLQATTAQWLALARVLLFDRKTWRSEFTDFRQHFLQQDLRSMSDLIAFEAQCYQRQQPVCYRTSLSLALGVLADLTERAPTFNLPNLGRGALYGIAIGADKSLALDQLLQRPSFCLNWSQFPNTMADYLAERQLQSTVDSAHGFNIAHDHQQCYFSLDRLSARLALPQSVATFWSQLWLKIVLNLHSTLLMGRMGYYQGNIMVQLKPSNAKLVDRAVRYVLFRLAQHDLCGDYRQVAHLVLEKTAQLQPGQSIVDLVYREFIDEP